MAFTLYQFFLVALMLTTGTLNTLSAKWTNLQEAHFCNRSGNKTKFEHPFVQACGMFIGEFLCLLAFKFVWYSTAKYRIDTMTYKGDASSVVVRYWPIRINRDVHLVHGEQEFNPLIFWVAATLDMLSTVLGYFALILTTASAFQMLRGSVMIFTALFSLLFLKRKITLMKWLGIFTVISGLVVVGVSSLIYASVSDDKQSTGEKIAGILLIILAMVFTGLQMVYEEKFIGKYNIPPLQVVGWEGIFGFLTLSLLIIPFSFIRMNASNASPNHYIEDVPAAFCQMADNHTIILAIIGNLFSIAFFNFAGVSVTKELSSTTRMVLDNGRTVIIWIVALAVGWEVFHPLPILGFVLLVIGMGIYNGVWEHMYRRYVKGERDDSERSELLPEENEAKVYDAQIARDKDALNS